MRIFLCRHYLHIVLRGLPHVGHDLEVALVGDRLNAQLGQAGGAIGGFLFRGTTGAIAAVGLGWWAVDQLSRGGKPLPPQQQVR